MARRRRKGVERLIAWERIDALFNQAGEAARAGNLERANRYVALARRIGMRYNVRMPRAHRRRFCRSCHAYLVPGRNATIRVGGGRVIVHCGGCGATMRFPYLREARAKRRATARVPGPQT